MRRLTQSDAIKSNRYDRIYQFIYVQIEVAGFLKRWRNKLQWRGRSIPPSAILERQARTFAELVLRQGVYQPYRMKW